MLVQYTERAMVVDITKEIESARKRVLQEVNLEFDRLLERAILYYPKEMVEKKEINHDVQYPLMGGTQIFKGTKPTKVIFPDNSLTVGSWKQVVVVVMDRCISDGNEGALRLLAGNISGKKRLLLAKTDADMRSPIRLAKGLYMETHYDTETLLNILTHRILNAIQYDYSGIQVALRNV